MAAATWQGTDRELARLKRAVNRNCDCGAGVVDVRPRTCSPHAMLAGQASLDRLLYVYRMRKLFITREFYTPPSRQMTGATAA
jgi:hypothetical protein